MTPASRLIRTSLIWIPTFLLVAACSSASHPAPTPARTKTPPETTAATTLRQPESQAPVPVENNPPGDIPDNIAFVPYRDPAGRFQLTHPEGWAQSTSADAVAFTDKLNGVRVSVGAAGPTPTEATARQRDLPVLQSGQPAFELRSVAAVSEPGGSGVLIVYRRNSAPDSVTGRQYRDEVQRYELNVAGRVVVVELSGPVGADNVDAYKTIITSLGAA